MFKKVILTITVMLASSLMLTACNTVKGLGRDIQSVGKSGEDAIN